MLDELIRQLDDIDFEIRRKARVRLLDAGPAAVEPLIAAVGSDTARQCWEAASILAVLKDSRAMEALGKALHSQNHMLAQVAARALGQFGKAAIPILIDGLSVQSNMTCVQIITVLSEMGNPDVIAALVDLLQRTESAVVRYTIIEALGNLGATSAISVVERFAHDTNHHVRERVVVTLDKLKALE